MGLMERMLKTTKLKDVEILSDTKLGKTTTLVSVPALNAALSGELDVGYSSGLTIFAGMSKMFKCLGPDTKIIIYTEEKTD